MLPWWTYPACGCFLAGAVCGWPLGYVHRGLIEWGRRCGRLLAWNRAHRDSWRGWRRRRNPVTRAYAELWRESDRLAAGFMESAPWITAGATPSQRADLCAVSVAAEEAARHL